MAWNDAPPTPGELKLAKSPVPSSGWDSKPPSEDELKNLQSSAGPSQGDAALEQFAKPITMGYLPKLQAAAEPITDRIFNLKNKIQGQPQAEPAPLSNLAFKGAAYDQSKLANMKRQDQEVADYPITSVGANIAGAITGGIATGGVGGAAVKAVAPGVAGSLEGLQAAKGLLPAAGRVGLAGAGGAAQSFAYDPGQLSPEDSELGARLNNAKFGAVLGAGAQGAGEALRSGADAFKGAARKYALKTAGPTAGDMKKLIRGGRNEDVADFMLNNKIPSSDIEDVVEKAGALKQEAGQKIGNIYEKVLDKKTDGAFLKSLSPADRTSLEGTGFKPVTDGKLLKIQLQKEMAGKAKGTQGFNQVSSILDDFAQKGDSISIQEANDMKGQLDHLINYDKDIKDNTVAQQGLKKVRDFIKQRVDDEVQTYGKVLNSQDFQALKEANKTYGNAATVENIAQGAHGREVARNWMSLSEKGALGIGAVAGFEHGGDEEHSGLIDKFKRAGIGVGVGYGIAHLGNKFGDSAKAKVFNALSKVSPNINPTSVGPAVGLLSGQFQNDKQTQGLLGGQRANSR